MNVSEWPSKKIVSGGQTGVDRAGLDWALQNGIAHGGWMTKTTSHFLGVKTLETQNSDTLDFHDLTVWTLKAALEAAFNAGYESTQNHGEAK